VNEDAAMEAALDAGADDIVRDGDSFIVTAPPAQLHSVQDALKAKKIPVHGAEVARIPKNTHKVDGKDAKKLIELVEALEEMDDVAKVFSNFDIDAEALAAVDG
jgi:transcriptional/translational regulatory protein YebC/TACO1